MSCFGGSDGEVIINASGGTGSYSYFVDDLYNSPLIKNRYLVNGLAANDYSVVVSDVNNCTSPVLFYPLLNLINLTLTYLLLIWAAMVTLGQH